MSFLFEIITPEKIVFSEQVDEVIVPTTTGQIGILPNHAPLISRIKQGEILIKKSGTETYLAVIGGFIEVDNNNVAILADYAIRAEDIEIAKAKEAEKKASELLKEKLTEKDFAIAQSQLIRSILEIKVASRRRQKV